MPISLSRLWICCLRPGSAAWLRCGCHNPGAGPVPLHLHTMGTGPLPGRAPLQTTCGAACTLFFHRLIYMLPIFFFSCSKWVTCLPCCRTGHRHHIPVIIESLFMLTPCLPHILLSAPAAAPDPGRLGQRQQGFPAPARHQVPEPRGKQAQSFGGCTDSPPPTGSAHLLTFADKHSCSGACNT
jgi:hypothetical protein